MQTQFLESVSSAGKKFINNLGYVTMDRILEGELRHYLRLVFTKAPLRNLLITAYPEVYAE